MRREASSIFETCQSRTEAGGQLPPAAAVQASIRKGICPQKRSVQSSPPLVPGPPNQIDIIWEVVDDFLEVVPVSQSEIEVIETYLASLGDPWRKIQPRDPA
jgi:hypothetical protein